MRAYIREMRIRPARTDDTPAITRIFCATRSAMPYLPPPPPEDEMCAIVEAHILPDVDAWLAEDDGRIVGYALLDGDFLSHLYIAPDAQGQGVGAALLDRAKELRPDGLRLWVFQKNERARRFYERHGFRLLEETDGADNMEREPDALYGWQPPNARP